MLEPATIHSDGCIASGQLSITRTAWIVDRWVFVLAILCRDSHGPAQTLVLRAMVEDKVNKYSKTHIKSDFVILQDKDGSDWQAMLVAIKIAPRAC